MAKKTYRTYNLRSLVLLLKGKDGKRIEITFRGGLSFDSTSKFTTANKEIQDALEECSGFGRDYYIESASEEESPASVAESAPEVAKTLDELTDMKDSKRFRNLVEMKNAMKEVGLKVEDGWNYTAAKAAARKAGYDYQIQR